jgi:hypothetical protein
MALTTTILTKINARQTGSNDLGTPVFPVDYSTTTSMGSGTASGLADLIFTDTRTIAASGTEDLDLTGSLTDALGATLTFVKVKAIMIKAASGNTNSVTVKPATTNGFLGPFNAAADKISIPPAGMMMVQAPSAGWAVTAGTGDLITIANSSSGTGVTYDIIIVGTSA